MKKSVRYIPTIALMALGFYELWSGLNGPMWTKMLEAKICALPEPNEGVFDALLPFISLLRSKLLLSIWFGVLSIGLAVIQGVLVLRMNKALNELPLKL